MILDYLYYKLYRATQTGSLKDIPQYITPIYLGGILGVNVLVIYLFLVKIDVLPYLFTNTKQGGWFLLVFIILSTIYYRQEKRGTILEKYSSENESERKRGNAIVSVYVALSFLLIFAVAFFRPGKL